MALNRLRLTPDNSSYSVTDGKEVVTTQLDGGASRFRRDFLGATSTVDVVFILDAEEYRYLRMFYKILTVSGANPFYIDLLLDLPVKVEHKAYFVPQSLKLTEQKGLSYWVSAQLEVFPAEIDIETEGAFAFLYGEFGSKWANIFPASEDILNDLINFKIPGIY